VWFWLLTVDDSRYPISRTVVLNVDEIGFAKLPCLSKSYQYYQPDHDEIAFDSSKEDGRV